MPIADAGWILFLRENRLGFVLRAAASLIAATFFALVALGGLAALLAIMLRALGFDPLPSFQLEGQALLGALFIPIFAIWALRWLRDAVTDILLPPLTYEGVAHEVHEYVASGTRIDVPMVAIRSGTERWDIYRRSFLRRPGAGQVGRPIRLRYRRHSRDVVALWFGSAGQARQREPRD